MGWWGDAYPGGPMVPLPGFPRPLFPPDAAKAGKTPSVDGPDVEAYKRTVSRAGRWMWAKYDQGYGNGFAHGFSGNVGVSGIAGVQRQQKVEPTGWVGKATFNLLRSIRIPEGLPHAGDMAMDAAAAELLIAAWREFGGEEPAPKKQVSSASARITIAETQVGIKEYPPNSNQTTYCTWYGMVGPWCAMFATWCDRHSAHPSTSFVRGQRYSYVPNILADARMRLNGLSITSSPVAGDLVCYDWSRDGEFDHVGMVEVPPNDAGDFKTVEGNTSGSSNSNGGEVQRRQRNRYSQTTVFVRAREP